MAKTRTPAPQYVKEVRAIINEVFPDVPQQDRYTNVYKESRTEKRYISTLNAADYSMKLLELQTRLREDVAWPTEIDVKPTRFKAHQYYVSLIVRMPL